jgi:hypothetical protein
MLPRLVLETREGTGHDAVFLALSLARLCSLCEAVISRKRYKVGSRTWYAGRGVRWVALLYGRRVGSADKSTTSVGNDVNRRLTFALWGTLGVENSVIQR